VDLQARPTATTTWKTVGRFTGDTVAPFSTAIGSVGGRQSRLYVPATKRVDQLEIVLTPASSTSARSSKTLAKFDVAGFNVASAQVGQMVKLTVDVRPGGTVKGALQPGREVLAECAGGADHQGQGGDVRAGRGAWDEDVLPCGCSGDVVLRVADRDHGEPVVHVDGALSVTET
jgi:hypothetical protein